MSGFNMEGVMKYYNTGDNITYQDRQTGKVAVAVTYGYRTVRRIIMLHRGYGTEVTEGFAVFRWGQGSKGL